MEHKYCYFCKLPEATSIYYRDQQSLFFEENINSLQITAMMDEMTTTSSNLKLFPESCKKTQKACLFIRVLNSPL